ncbi:oxidative stress defense protein [Vibrio aphrogenes]|uniref:oxidative stress defense protein n=1 Tax=Vibrio aphrogenes TaxID=1891186 RepID=UPI000B34BFE2|nr:oxidative stress defense protein [Vibrio aphrogenes]
MNYFIKPIALLTVIFFSLNSWAVEAGTPTLSTSGYGEMTAKPDMAVFTVAIQTEKTQADQAKKTVDTVVTQFISVLNKQGVKREDIQSGHLQLSPQYTYPKDEKPILNGHQAVRYITVTVNQLEKLNALLDAALDSGVNRVNNIQLKVKDETQYKQKARLAAIADAKEKAQAVATGFDAQLDGVWSIEYHNNSVRPVVMAKSVMMESQAIDQSYQDQSIVISDKVDVVFKIKNK